MNDIVGFLTARLDEDEATLRVLMLDAQIPGVVDPGGWAAERMLREVRAKRKILALHYLETESYLDADGIERPGHHCWECDQRDWPCPTFRAIAAVYIDHPDYQLEWA